MKLLLVEENAAMQTTLQRSFERRGIQVVVCGDGALALNGWPAAVRDVVMLDPSLPDTVSKARAWACRSAARW